MQKQSRWMYKALQVLVVVVIAILIINLSTTFSRFVISSSTQALIRTVVVIDAGHGDFDPGAIAADKTEEKDLNLSIALKLAEIFRVNGYLVVMTRDTDETLASKGPSEAPGRKKSDTQNRAYLGDSFDDAVMISIHQNTFSDRSQHGTQVFYGQKNEDSSLLAACIMKSVVANLQPGNKRETKRGPDTIYILKAVKNPISLVECGFMTNYAELQLLKDEEYQQKMAWCIYLGYCEYQRELTQTTLQSVNDLKYRE